MVRLLKRAELDADAYDRCVATSSDRIVYAFSWYLDAVSPDWQCFVAGEYAAVMPVPIRKRYGLLIVQQPLFCHQLGVFGQLKAGVVDLFLEALYRNFPYVASYQLHAGNAAVLARPYIPLTNHVLSLNQPYEKLKMGYSRGRRYHLRKPLPPGWTLADADDSFELFNLFVRHNSGGLGRIHPEAGEILQRLTKALCSRGKVRIRMAMHYGQAEAGSLFVLDNNRLIHLFCGASPLGRQVNARLHLLDELIREHAETNTLLDFESPEVPALARFNLEFGAVPERFARLAFNRLPGGIRALQAFKKRLHRFWASR